MARPERDALLAGTRYAALGIEFGGIIAAAVVAGYYLDTYLGTAPLMTLVLTVGGMVGALRRLLWSLKKHSSR